MSRKQNMGLRKGSYPDNGEKTTSNEKNLRGRRFQSEEGIDVTINVFFSFIPINEWFEAFNLWKIRLQKGIDAGGDHFEHS
ncbi:uncharacterized protein TNCV_1216121 [Trichonephila clavipes]|nr:uncharacterized protein TNCV_1216121 [Trichonephila clavipes]